MSVLKKVYIVPYGSFWLTAVYENDKLAEVYADKAGSEGLLDRIYVGKVKTVVKNIDAAFIEIEGGIVGYYKIGDNKNPVFFNHKVSEKLVPGDEILVQVVKEGVKTKAPVLSSNISLSGRYAVLKSGRDFSAVSSKIEDEGRRQALLLLAQSHTEENIGFVVRTKAEAADDASVADELGCLKAQYDEIVRKAHYLTCFSQVYKAPPEYIERIRQMADESLVKVSTDIRAVYDSIYGELSDLLGDRLVFYEDAQLDLIKLLSLETQLERLLSKKVWLKSGGFLVIEPTEAFVVIDVNTGRYTGKKTGEETFLKINMEAAEEIAKQLRLRNLSGIILIDFINMKQPENKKMLIETLKAEIAKDSVRTVFVDMTRLNIAELTRKKVRKPLYEQLMGERT